MGTKFSEYLGASKASDSPEEAAERALFAAALELGLQFRDARVSRKLTQIGLARVSGVSQADISRIERGAGNPTEATLQRLASALGGRVSLVVTAVA